MKLPARASLAPFWLPRRVYGWQGGASSHMLTLGSSSSRCGMAAMSPCSSAERAVKRQVVDH